MEGMEGGRRRGRREGGRERGRKREERADARMLSGPLDKYKVYRSAPESFRRTSNI